MKNRITKINEILGIVFSVFLIMFGVLNLIRENYSVSIWIFYSLALITVILIKDKTIEIQDDLINDLIKERSKFIEKHIISRDQPLHY